MPDVHGNIEGIRKTVLAELKGFYEEQLPTDQFMPQELLSRLCGISASLNRELALYLTRDGEVADVIVGRADSVDLPDLRLRRGVRRLSMIRCVHTHPRATGELSDVDLSALGSLRLDAICAVGVNDAGEPTSAQAAFLDPDAPEQRRVTELLRARRLPDDVWMEEIERADARFLAEEPELAGAQNTERAVLVGIDSEESLFELQELAKTAGAVTVLTVFQKRAKPDVGTLVGKGKAQELALRCQAVNADLAIFDDALTGAMQKNLEEVLRIKVIDRTALILDIFAARAVTREGKLQVEMAQLQYRSQRLMGQGLVLSRLAGGIGTRGPGESKLEVNRRRIRERMTDLERQLALLQRQRALRRQERERRRTPLVALVGYTNAGKSTLFNQMTGASVYVEDELFATLDSVSRPIQLPHGGTALLTDTVGFIRKLPHELVKAFRATLEEAALADVLVIVSDGADERLLERHQTVCEVLDSLGATSAPRIDVLNKRDLAPAPKDALPGAIALSARTCEGVGALLAAIEETLDAGAREYRLLIPFDRYGLLDGLHRHVSVLSQEHADDGVIVTVRAEASYVKNVCREGARLLGDEIQ